MDKINNESVMTKRDGKYYNRRGERIWYPDRYMDAVNRNRHVIKN